MADFYETYCLRLLATQKLNEIIDGIWDTNELMEVLGLVCNPPLESNGALEGTAMRVITEHPPLLDKLQMAAILEGKPSFTFSLLKLSHTEEIALERKVMAGYKNE